MSELVSEPIVPQAGSFDTGAMGRGEPGLPAAFTWRERTYRIMQRVSAWKESSREGARAGGELYLRRHCYRLLVVDGSVWIVYFTRQASPGQNPRRRWFLYALDSPTPPRDATTEPPGPTNHGMPRDVT